MKHRPLSMALIAFAVGVAILSAEASAPAGGQRAYLPLLAGHGPAPGNWLTLLDEAFEGMPAAGWRFFDGNGPTSGEYRWAGRDCRPLAGDHSAWAVGGGTEGGSLPCGSDYPDNADSWMIYGPFSLADAQMAELRFSFYLRDLAEGDAFCWGASEDGVSFSGLCLNADPGGWTPLILDLGNLFGDEPPSVGLLGKPQVWIGFRFASDTAGHVSEGAYVDSVIVRKCLDRACSNTTATMPAQKSAPATMVLRQ